MRGDDDAPASDGLEDASVLGRPLDVDIFGAQPDRLGEKPEPLVFGAVEEAALLPRPAGDDNRSKAVRERPGHVDVADAVEAEFNEVGVARDGVPSFSKLPHRIGGDRDAQAGCGHKTKKPLQPSG